MTLGFILTFIAGFSTMLGTFIIFIKSNKTATIITSSLAFAAGVMACVSIIDLIPESLTLLNKVFFSFPALLISLIFIIIGCIFSLLCDKYLQSNNDLYNRKLYRVGMISMLAIIIHNIPEGIATFMATTSDTKLGISLAIAISLHNIPEGISISVPIYYATKSKSKALMYTLISGLSEPLGAFLAYLFLSPFINDTIMGCLFSLIAGIMLYISLFELLPTSFKYKKRKTTIIFLVIGILFMFISHLLF